MVIARSTARTFFFATYSWEMSRLSEPLEGSVLQKLRQTLFQALENIVQEERPERSLTSSSQPRPLSLHLSNDNLPRITTLKRRRNMTPTSPSFCRDFKTMRLSSPDCERGHENENDFGDDDDEYVMADSRMSLERSESERLRHQPPQNYIVRKCPFVSPIALT